MPFLLFAANRSGDSVTLDISGGTNASFSLSFEYLDQVLLPTLEERFDIKVERQLKQRGWSLGPQLRGAIAIMIHPLTPTQKLHFKAPARYMYPVSYEVKSVDVSIIVPTHSHQTLQEALVKDLGDVYPGADVYFKVTEDSGHDARWYIILVGHSSGGMRWGKDLLASMSKKVELRDIFIGQMSKNLCRQLYEEVAVGGTIDQYLEDQVIYYTALCDGYSTFPRPDAPGEIPTGFPINTIGELDINDGTKIQREKNHEPFGHSTLHAQTARWIVGEVLPGVEFYNKGDLVKGVGTSIS